MLFLEPKMLGLCCRTACNEYFLWCLVLPSIPNASTYFPIFSGSRYLKATEFEYLSSLIRMKNHVDSEDCNCTAQRLVISA
jgi:hypothetical protein